MVPNLRSKWESKDCPFLVFCIPVPLSHRLFNYGYVRNRFLLISMVIQSHNEVRSPQTAVFALYCAKHKNNFPYTGHIDRLKKLTSTGMPWSHECFKTIINVIFFPWILFAIPISQTADGRRHIPYNSWPQSFVYQCWTSSNAST